MEKKKLIFKLFKISIILAYIALFIGFFGGFSLFAVGLSINNMGTTEFKTLGPNLIITGSCLIGWSMLNVIMLILDKISLKMIPYITEKEEFKSVAITDLVFGFVTTILPSIASIIFLTNKDIDKK